MDFSWNKEQLALRDATLEFARKELSPGAGERDEQSRFPAELWKKCANFGVLGMPLPKRYGGRDLGMLDVVLAMEALGAGCEDNGLLFSIGAQLWSMQMPLLIFGTEEQRERFLPDLIANRRIGAHAVSEYDAGSDIFKQRTLAMRDGDNYVLSGQKAWNTNGPVAEIFLILATVDPELGDKGLTTFLVEKGTHGLSVRGPLVKMGMRTAMMGEVALENCVVPAANILGKVGSGSAIFNSSMEWERAFILAPAVGAMQRELDRCLGYARTRQQFGRPIGQNQAISHKLVNMSMRLETSRLLLYRGAWMKTQRRRMTREPSEIKLQISESWVGNCLDAMQIHGARGYMVESGLERQLRDALASRIYSGTSEIQKVIISAYLGV